MQNTRQEKRHRCEPSRHITFLGLLRETSGYCSCDLADANFELLKENPRHPSLHLKKINRMWSVRVGRKYRALAIEDDGNLIWFWIGTHAEYDKLIS